MCLLQEKGSLCLYYIMEDNRQFHTPNVTPLYPSLLDSCSPLTSPLNNPVKGYKQKHHRHQSNNSSRVFQYGISTSQLPGMVPLTSYQCDTKVIVKVPTNKQVLMHISPIEKRTENKFFDSKLH